jgi:hypothetical protein
MPAADESKLAADEAAAAPSCPFSLASSMRLFACSRYPRGCRTKCCSSSAAICASRHRQALLAGCDTGNGSRLTGATASGD